MNRNKTIVIIIISIILLVVAIICGAFIFYNKNKENQKEKTDVTSVADIKPVLSKMYEKMILGEVYAVSISLDKNNRTTTVRDGEKARIDFYKNGIHTTDIIKDGNTYSLIHKDKKYFEYISNTIELTNLLRKFERVKQNEMFAKGEEEIDGVLYYYEEYENTNEFLIEYKGEDTKNAYTRFYFEDNYLVYIKTILKEREELLKVEMSYTSNDVSFEIPSDYQKIEM